MDEKGNTTQEMAPDAPAARRKGRILPVVLGAALALALVGNAVLGFQLWRLKQHADAMDGTYSESYFYFDSITVASFEEKVAAGEDFIVLITRPNCSNCMRLERPFIELAQQQSITGKIYHLNVVLLRQDDEAWAAFKARYGFEGTPTYARFAAGRQVSCVGWTYEHSIDLPMVEDWLAAQADYFAA